MTSTGRLQRRMAIRHRMDPERSASHPPFCLAAQQSHVVVRDKFLAMWHVSYVNSTISLSHSFVRLRASMPFAQEPKCRS